MLEIYNIDTVYIFQNLNKQAYDLAKALLKRTAQAIEPYITNVSLTCNWLSEGLNRKFRDLLEAKFRQIVYSFKNNKFVLF